jgi:hypothetical protein
MIYPITLFGYELDIPTNTNIYTFINLLNEIHLREPYEIHAIVPFFDTDCDEDDLHEAHYEYIIPVIGFKPHNDFEIMQEQAAQLKSYVIDNVLLEGIDIIGSPQFFSGIKWSFSMVDNDYNYDNESYYEELSDESDESDESDDNEDSKNTD